MKNIAILLSVFFIGFSYAQIPIDKEIQQKKTLKEDPDARVFVFNEQKNTSLSRNSIMTKEETLKNKKGYKRVNSALNKEIKAKKRRDRKKLKTQDKLFDKYIKESKICDDLLNELTLRPIERKKFPDFFISCTKCFRSAESVHFTRVFSIYLE